MGTEKVIVLSKAQLGVGTILLVNPLTETLIKWDKNRAVVTDDDSGDYSEKSLKVAETRMTVLEGYIKGDDVFHNARVGGWQTNEGFIMVTDANNRLEVIRSLHKNGKNIPGIGVPWLVELFNDKTNPKTGNTYTKEEFDDYCILMNRRQNAQWQFCDICDYYKRYGNKNAIYIVDTVKKLGLNYTITAEIAFGQGATAKRQGDAIFMDNIEPWAYVNDFVMLMKSLSKNYVHRNDGNENANRERDKTVGEKLIHAHELQAFVSIYKACCFAGVKKQFEDFMLTQFHRTRNEFVVPSGQKQIEWQGAIYNFMKLPIKGKMEELRNEIISALENKGIRKYYDEHKNKFPTTFDNWAYNKIAM